MEHVAWQKRLFGKPALNVDEGAQKDPSKDEGDWDIRCGPSLGCVAAVCEGKDDQHKTWNNGDQAPPVHLNTLSVLVFFSVRNAEPCNHPYDGEDDGTDEEEPPPSRELSGDTSEEDTGEEANRCEGAIKTEDEVLSWSRTIL